MHKAIRSLTLITLLLAPASVQAKPTSAQLIAKGLIKIRIGALLALKTLGGIAFTAIVGPSLMRGESFEKKSLFYGGTSIGILGLASLSSYLIRTGIEDLNRTPAKVKDQKNRDDDDSDDLDDEDYDDLDEQENDDNEDED